MILRGILKKRKILFLLYRTIIRGKIFMKALKHLPAIL